jgi:hypothetical protein
MMNDLDLLKDLGRVAREDEAAEDARWERWEKWHDGELSDEEEAELLALARDSEEDAAALEAFRPLGPEFRTRVLEALDAEAKGREKTPLLQRFWPWLTLSATGLAAAAGIFFARLPEAIPPYALTELHAENAATRGTAATEVLTRGDAFLATIQPAELLPSGVRLKVRCGILPSNGSWIALPCEISNTSPKGAIKVEGAVARDAPVGLATIWIVLGHEGRLPAIESLDSLSTDAPPREKAWVTIPGAVEIRPH